MVGTNETDATMTAATYYSMALPNCQVCDTDMYRTTYHLSDGAGCDLPYTKGFVTFDDSSIP